MRGCAREVVGPVVAIGKWRDPISWMAHPGTLTTACGTYVRMPHTAEAKSRTAFVACQYGAIHADDYAPHRWRSVVGAFPGGVEHPKSLLCVSGVGHPGTEAAEFLEAV